jgi:hypothetical protein
VHLEHDIVQQLFAMPPGNQTIQVERKAGNLTILNKTIYLYWGQGFDNAPYVVKKVAESWKKTQSWLAGG